MREYNTYTTSQTAALLQQMLGDLRAWNDFLTDCIRHKANLDGLMLMPRFRSTSRPKRPAYAGEDIREFVEAVWGKRPDLKRKHAVVGRSVKFDPANPSATPDIEMHPSSVGKFYRRRIAPALCFGGRSQQTLSICK